MTTAEVRPGYVISKGRSEKVLQLPGSPPGMLVLRAQLPCCGEAQSSSGIDGIERPRVIVLAGNPTEVPADSQHHLPDVRVRHSR